MNPTPLQPLLHDAFVVLRAPTQVWSGDDGCLGGRAVDGVYVSDLRLVSRLTLALDGDAVEHIATSRVGASDATFVSVARGFGDPLPDPDVRVEHRRVVDADGVTETVTVRSRRGDALTTELIVALTVEATPLDRIKQGLGSTALAERPALGDDHSVRWRGDGVRASLTAPGADVSLTEGTGAGAHRADAGRPAVGISLRWPLTVPARGSVSATWRIDAVDELAVVAGDARAVPWSRPAIAGDERLARWVGAALDDLDALRMTPVDRPDLGFLAAGAPWFFTLFGRDSLWTARFLLPLGTDVAHDTLRILAGLQGTAHVPERAEEPGKIMHELRRGELTIDGDVHLPPLYYGTVDATALWIVVLCDAWEWGLDDLDAAELLPNLEAALTWLRDDADADGDGLLEYIDRSGHGLANQGWKDSGDSVQWRDGTLATGPIALCEVQAYAYEAATRGADLLDHFGRDGAPWRAWAARLKARFHETFWVRDAAGDYPAIALDADKRAVDTLTSNIGHLLGTGLLDQRQSALVARRLVSPELDSGFGLRTMSTDSAGYWPLSYHGGTVWTHDTAIAIAGLTRAGFRREADLLIEGLLAAASAFDHRMPELHAGDAAGVVSRPVPYPAACRPQAWSAAASVSVLASRLGLHPDAREGVLGVSPHVPGAVTVSGLVFGGASVAVAVNADSEVVAASGAPIDVR